MTTTHSSTNDFPAGPSTPYDLNTTADAFNRLAEWVSLYGDIFYIPPAKRKDPAFFVNDPDALKQILISNNDCYSKGVGFERVKMLLGNGIIVSDGPFWRKQRRMIQPAFSRDFIAQIVEQVKLANLKLLGKWQQLAEQHGSINITESTNELALEIILRALFSEDLDTIFAREGGKNPFAILTDDSARDLKLAVRFRALTKLVGDVIQQRRQDTPARTDFLSVFMDARDKETGEPMSDKELIDEVMTLIVAGSETSATTMNWVWYSLSQHPDVESRLHAEVDNASYAEVPGFDHISELPYTRQVTEEVLRLYPPVWLFTRKAIRQDKLGKYTIPAGSDIFISPYYLHRHPGYWDQPEKFDPERFTPEAIKQRHKLAYIPFSAGPRRCIGDFFGIVESQVHFGLMARHFRMEHINDHPVELLPEVNLRTRNPINMRITSRK